ncbi:PEP-CTERM sorting domain-containing protein [Congregibacter variabilis]|uniref:PEP-CTERM sorting domain-containing protein n=1 Tax=Congregibacter variabilis TaxID=3081200 RepID=A0ABZ0I474_9GAMM|nr:PEP-CTERM sorting domain-containing protein [Congregibacter sp. IMCC43200]
MKSLFKTTALTVFAAMGANSAATFAIPIESVITGADMTGIEVEVAFLGGGSETAVWGATSTDASVPEGEGFAGAAAGTGWSLSQQGFTLGGNSLIDNSVLGLWSFSNFSTSIFSGFQVRGLPGSIVFDILGPVGPEGTPGSDIGRAFLADPLFPGISDVSYSYSDPFSGPDLFSTLDVSFAQGFAPQSQLSFLADTDSVAAVPVPATLLSMALGLGLLLVDRRRRVTPANTNAQA